MQADRLFKHWQPDKCHKLTEIRLRRRDVEMAVICGEMEFNLYGGEGDERVENIPTFQYMGQPLDQTDDDWPAVWQNIMRERSVWGKLGTNLTGGVRSQGVGKFLQGGGAGNSILWVRNVGPFSVNGKEDIGDAHGVPENDHGEESKAIRR